MSTSPNWWYLIKRLFGLSREDLSGSGDNLLQPSTRPNGLDQGHTVTGSYANSGLKEAFNDPQFYYINDNGEVELVQDTDRIRITKRAYLDGSVGIVFQDMATGEICMPRGVEFNSNVVPSSRRAGEYELRNGGSISGTAPSNIIWNSGDINYAVSIVANSVVSTPDPPAPDPPAPAEPTQKSYNTSQFGKLIFRTMVGNSSLFYQGEIIVKQRQLPDGGYFAQFFKPDGVTPVSPSNATGSGVVDIRSLFKTIDGQYGLYISPGGGDVYQFLENTYEGAPPNPPPPTINPKIVHFATNSIKYLLLNANGSVYTADNFNVRYYYNPNNGNYQIQFQDLNGNNLTLSGRDLPPLASNGYYQMQYQMGKTFDQQWNEEFSGTPPTPGPPQPPIPSGYRLLRGNSDSAWKYLRVMNRDGSRFMGTYYIQYQQRNFRGRYALQVQNLTCYRIDQDGNKVYLNVDWGDVNFQNDSSNPVYDRNGNEIGETYSMTLPNNTSGAGSLDQFLTQFYSNNNEYPNPPPTPPTVYGFTVPTNTLGLIFKKSDGTRYEGTVNILYQHQGDHWQWRATIPHSSGSPLTVIGDGVHMAGRTDDGPFYNMPFEEGVSFDDTFLNAYRGTPPPDPDPPAPVDPTEPRSMGTLNSADFAIVWLNADGSQYDGVVKGNYIEARASDGKRVVYFTDSDGNRLQAHVPDGFSGWDPTIAPQPAHGRRIHEEVEYEVPDDVTNFSEAEQWFQNGCDVHGNAPPIPFGDSGLMVDGFILYHDEMDAFGVEDKIPDELKDAGIIGFVNYDGDYQRKEERYGFVPLPDQPKGGGDIFDRPEVAAPAAPQEVERPASPTPYDEPSEEAPTGAELAEAELELADQEEAPRELELEYDRLEESFDEKEWISAKAVFAEQAYKIPDRRAEDVFGMQYVPDLSNERLALYINPNGKQGVVALRGTQSLVDFLSDAFVVAGLGLLSNRYNVTKKELANITERYPDMRIELIGHSLGGTITNELAGEDSIWRSLGIATGKGHHLIAGLASNAHAAKSIKDIYNAATNVPIETLEELSYGEYGELTAHFARALGLVRNSPGDFGLTPEQGAMMEHVFERLYNAAAGRGNIEAELTRSVLDYSRLVRDHGSAMVLSQYGAAAAEEADPIAFLELNRLIYEENAVSATPEALLFHARLTGQDPYEYLRTRADYWRGVLETLEQARPSSNPEIRRVFADSVDALYGGQEVARDVTMQAFDEFVAGGDPTQAVSRSIERLSNSQRAELYRSLDAGHLLPTRWSRAGKVGLSLLKWVGFIVADKLIGHFLSTMITEFPLDRPKKEDVKVKDWLYSHGGKFTTVRGQNDLISSRDTITSLLSSAPNVRNIDLGSSLINPIADHSLSNFIIKEHERFKRSGDDAKGLIQWADLEFIAKVLKTISGQREPEEL